MVFVAVAAVVCLVVTHRLRRSALAFRSPFSSARLGASAPGRGQPGVWVAGQPVPVTIRYDAVLGAYKPAAGENSRMLAEVWFEDPVDGRYVSGYTFDVTLTTGGRESTSGSFVWDADLPRPGAYELHTRTSVITPAGPRPRGGKTTHYRFVDPGSPPQGPRP